MGGSTAFARNALTLAGRAVAGTSVGPTTQADASVGPTARVGSGRCTAAGAYASQDAIRSSAAQQARTMPASGMRTVAQGAEASEIVATQ